MTATVKILGIPVMRNAPSAPQLSDYLPHRSLLILLGCLLFVVAPHFTHLPLWESAAIVAIVIWRGFASARQWQLPPQVLKLGLALAAFGLVYWSYGRITGQTAGVALLVLMLALKLTEMRSRRDVMVTVFLMYFLLVTHFLYSQEMWTILYLFGAAIAITTVLVDAHHPGDPMPLRRSARTAGVMLLQSLPLMVVFFVLFPRIPGPIWGLPSDAGAARSGLSDSMSPGDISSLVQTDEPAFRVKFIGSPPTANERYWRGPVFDFFDGRSWAASPNTDLLPAAIVEPMGRTVRYTMTLEPMRTRWLFLLDSVDTKKLPPGSSVSATGTVLSRDRVRERKLYDAVSDLRYVMDPMLSDRVRRRALQLPEGFNPRATALAQQWRANGDADSTIVDRALQLFNSEPFKYTLSPPPLGRDSIDQFLFTTRRGFCEHYSGAFTFLMRAAGVPSRVVTGYLGGQFNELGDYYLITQSDAHAWSEVWLEGRGWIRIDPTSAIAPGRVESGLVGAVSATEGLPNYLRNRTNWKLYFEVRWDLINAKWNEWILGYGPETQQTFLAIFGMADLTRMLLGLTAGVSILLVLTGVITMRRAGPPPISERSLELWRAAGKRLHAIGFDQRPDEGPRDFARRVTNGEPALAEPMSVILDAYLRLRYAGEQNPALEQTFTVAIRKLRRA